MATSLNANFHGEPVQVKETVDSGPNALFHSSQCSLSAPSENIREDHYSEMVY